MSSSGAATSSSASRLAILSEEEIGKYIEGWLIMHKNTIIVDLGRDSNILCIKLPSGELYIPRSYENIITPLARRVDPSQTGLATREIILGEAGLAKERRLIMSNSTETRLISTRNILSYKANNRGIFNERVEIFLENTETKTFQDSLRKLATRTNRALGVLETNPELAFEFDVRCVHIKSVKYSLIDGFFNNQETIRRLRTTNSDNIKQLMIFERQIPNRQFTVTDSILMQLNNELDEVSLGTAGTGINATNKYQRMEDIEQRIEAIEAIEEAEEITEETESLFDRLKKNF